jgi:hypothetical protein
MPPGLHRGSRRPGEQLSLRIPKRKITIFTGVSDSGKSSMNEIVKSVCYYCLATETSPNINCAGAALNRGFDHRRYLRGGR